MTATKQSITTASTTRTAMTATRNMLKALMTPWMNSMKMVKCSDCNVNFKNVTHFTLHF